MNKAKEILYKHAKSNGCKSDLLRNPFLEQAVLNAINEALTIPAVVGRSEQLPCPHCGQLEPCAGNSPETCYHPKVC